MEDEEGEMPKANDRKRAKDTIIEGIAKAVKHIQSHQLSQSSEDQGVVLRNSDWQFHKLVENLDHAFLYGLRHFSSGYWIVVQEFTHKSTIEDILKLSNVITNLGRSRAWLYHALSDHLLESYINCFIKNAELVRKHYVKEALVLDEQRLELLLTLSSGLELIAFDLEANVQYLDLCSCVKLRTENQEEDAEDDISLCSMISLQSQNSLSEETNRSRIPVSPLSLLSNLMKPLSFKLQPTSTLTLEETEEEKKMRIENFANTEVIPTDLPGDDETNQSRSIISPLSLLSNLMKPLSSKLQPTSTPSLEETEEAKKMRIENLANAEVVPAVTLGDEETNQSRSAMISPLSLLSNLIRPFSSKLQPTSDLSLEEAEEEKKIQAETFARTEVVPPELPEDNSIDDIDGNGEVEVIRVRPKRLHSRKIDRLQKSPSAPDSDNSSLVSVDSCACLLPSPISSESSRGQTVPEDSNGARSTIGHSNMLSSNIDDDSGDAVIKKNDAVLNFRPSDELTDETKNLAEDALSQDEKLFRILGDNFDTMPGEKVCEDSAVEWKGFTEFSTELKNDLPVNAVDFESTSSPSVIPEQSFVDVDKHDDEILASEEGEQHVDDALVTSVEELSIYDDSQCTTAAIKCSEVASSAENHDNASSGVDALPPSVESTEAKSPSSDLSTSSMPKSESNESFEMIAPEWQTQADCFTKTSHHPSEIEVDNNLKVVLMLEIFLHEEEELFKVFRTCQGHTEGEVVVTYVVITSHYLYLLRPSNLPNKFTREAAITYKELDYISISLNWQILHIVCLARHNQFWITTGDESLTRILVSHLTHAVYMSPRASTQGLSNPSLTVLEDATAQKISIARLVSEELGITREEVSLMNYSLVHWEDSEAIRGGDLRLSHGHRGVLFYKSSTSAYLFSVTSSWHKGYFVLEQGVLHQYPDKSCSGMPERSISFTPDQCLGCRRCPLATDRKHVFEILLPNGPSFELSAPSEAELQEWLVRLCQATCDQSSRRASVFGCVACCTVVTQSHVFVCHEDLQTNFLRSLACLSLSSLSEIQTDSNAPTYCIIVSKLPAKKLHNEEKWCIYFKSASEQEKFISAILDACTRSEQSALRMERVDAVMSARCQTGIAKLNKFYEMGAV